MENFIVIVVLIMVTVSVGSLMYAYNLSVDNRNMEKDIDNLRFHRDHLKEMLSAEITRYQELRNIVTNSGFQFKEIDIPVTEKKITIIKSK